MAIKKQDDILTIREFLPEKQGVSASHWGPQLWAPVLGRGVPTTSAVKTSGDYISEMQRAAREQGAALEGLTYRLSLTNSFSLGFTAEVQCQKCQGHIERNYID